ncbi:hypothetical protein P256_00916 [Acinetobacter nectaris CIP 110549]|uniref:HMA domain-containing protein n=1 Tax=Acinetobacter nectaris CIP 110549 TaxID=1392540 RepID=V2TCW1_9GAMM|nr:heavy-metal-associated domain-containing protein [Acinetobacter nectaris]ESK40463.1 hypothetical protein P256_00916 [Acinetobacter nectaris CIP 110549]
MQFEIPNMTCGGCARGVTAIIKDLDENAEVDINLEKKLVTVNTHETEENVKAALTEDGFPPITK